MGIQSAKASKRAQLLISIGTITMVSLICFFTQSYFGGYKVVALILLMAVSLLAVLYDILPVLLASCLSAVTLNFFFIPPTFTLHIETAEDVLLFALYFLIALVSSVLSNRIRNIEKKLRDEEEKEKTIKLYNTLLNSLSHELRTPISGIIGTIDTLKENFSQLNEKQKSELFDEIEKSAFRLNRQVENLLSMSRLESGTLHLKPDWTDMTDFIPGLLAKTEAENHRFEIFYDEPLPLFKLDRMILEQVIHNLIHNAIQHTPSGTLIKIRVSSDSGACRIIVSDNGPGVPDEISERVFEKFYRANNSKTGGTGLGLSISKGFAEAMNGYILCSKSPEGGAQFSVFIPCEVSYLSELKNE